MGGTGNLVTPAIPARTSGWGSTSLHTTSLGTHLSPKLWSGRCWQSASFHAFPRHYIASGVKSQALESGCPGWNTGILQLVCGHVLAHLGPSLLAHWPPVFLGELNEQAPRRHRAQGLAEPTFSEGTTTHLRTPHARPRMAHTKQPLLTQSWSPCKLATRAEHT